MTLKMGFVFLIALLPNNIKAMHTSDTDLISPHSMYTETTSSPKSATTGTPSPDLDKYDQDLHDTRDFMFNLLADRQNLTGAARIKFINDKWKQAKSYDAKAQVARSR